MTEIKYDVFISFRGKDTRTTLTSHLYKALCGKNIVTYKDDKKLKSGDEISPSLLTAIDRSKISVVIFSKSYASSRWCLDELVHILDCRKRNGQFVIPIFYHVDTSHVRYQSESYATDFAKLEKRFKLERLKDWRSALTEAANLSGFDYPGDSRTESDLVEDVVKHIWRTLKRLSLSYTKGLFGIENGICQIESLLCLDSPNVCVVGIWGMGGVGKTTIANVVFDQYSYKFEACCFLENVGKELEKPGGLNLLRRTLFSELLCEENININTSSIRSTFVWDRLCYKKALIVLDDVNEVEQFELLLNGSGDFGHLGPGTRLIITSRDMQVLRNVTEEDKIYHVEELNWFEARELFEFHAFKKSSVPKRYQILCSIVVNYAKGIPLALKILGSTLHSRSIEEWESVLDKLKEYPNDRIQGVLKISYDRLDFTEKMIFLDIACFFKGWNKDLVIRIFEGCNFFPVTDLAHLIDSSLISIGQHNTIKMHDLIQEMGWNLDGTVSIKEPWNRNRVWFPDDVCDMLRNITRTKQVEGIFYEIDGWARDEFPHVCQIRYLNKESFSRMSHLRRLQISYSENEDLFRCEFYRMSPLRLLQISYSGNKDLFKCKFYFLHGVGSFVFPRALRLFLRVGFPSKSLPIDLNLRNLVELQIPHSQLERLCSILLCANVKSVVFVLKVVLGFKMHKYTFCV